MAVRETIFLPRTLYTLNVATNRESRRGGRVEGGVDSGQDAKMSVVRCATPPLEMAGDRHEQPWAACDCGPLTRCERFHCYIDIYTYRVSYESRQAWVIWEFNRSRKRYIMCKTLDILFDGLHIYDVIYASTTQV